MPKTASLCRFQALWSPSPQLPQTRICRLTTHPRPTLPGLTHWLGPRPRKRTTLDLRQRLVETIVHSRSPTSPLQLTARSTLTTKLSFFTPNYREPLALIPPPCVYPSHPNSTTLNGAWYLGSVTIKTDIRLLFSSSDGWPATPPPTTLLLQPIQITAPPGEPTNHRCLSFQAVRTRGYMRSVFFQLSYLAVG